MQVLGEAAEASLAALPTSDGTNGYVITPDLGMFNLISEAKDDVCKRVLPVRATGTKALLVGEGTAFPLATFTTTPTMKAWTHFQNARFDPTGADPAYELVKMSARAFENFYTDRETAANAPPLYAAPGVNDPRVLNLHRKTTLAGDLTVTGYIIPADLTSDVLTFGAWLDADDDPIIALWAAVKITEKITDDPVVRAKRAVLAVRLDMLMLGMRDRIPAHIAKHYLEPYYPYSATATE